MISVIIPMYNSRKTIKKCIDSVLMQTKVDLIKEIIIVDDGSTDGSYEFVLESYKKNSLVKILYKDNGGVSSARNYGIKVAKGNWIALLDSDDIWLPSKIEKQWNKIKKYEDIRFIGTGRNNEKIKWGKRCDAELYKLNLKQILIKNWPHTSTVLIHKNIFDDVGLFNESRRYAEDGDLWNRIVISYPIYYLIEPLEIAGDFKLQFGERGLSSNLLEMHRGNLENIKDLFRNRNISLCFYGFLRIYYCLKYFRRVIISSLRDREKNEKENRSIYE